VQSYKQRKNAYNRPGRCENPPAEAAALSYNELITGGQSKLIEGQSARDRPARLGGRAKFLIVTPDYRLTDVGGARRSTGSHYRVSDRDVRSEGEVSRTSNGAENPDAHERSDLDRLRLDVLLHLGRDAILQL
jgi:hypothetical protein